MKNLICDHYLSLPKIQPFQPLDLTAVTLADEHISIPVSPEFELLWRNGPRGHTPAEIDFSFRLLVATLGKMVCAGRGNVKSFAKTGPADLVTAIDHGVEMLFRVWISTFFPTHKIIGEEGHKDSISPEDYVWYIDPVDGTTNFVEGHADVSLLIGCLYQGKPFWSVLALPFSDHYFSMSYHDPNVYLWSSETPQTPKPYVLDTWSASLLGTEYMDSRKQEAKIFERLSTRLGLPPLRVKSIGVNLGYFLTGELAAFYKPKAKLWDVISPLAIASHLFGPKLTCEIIIPDGRCFGLFSNDPGLYTYLNHCHKRSCNAGLILAFPSHRSDLRIQILEGLAT